MIRKGDLYHMQAMKDQIKLAAVFVDILNMFQLMSYEGNEGPDQTVRSLKLI